MVQIFAVRELSENIYFVLLERNLKEVMLAAFNA